MLQDKSIFSVDQGPVNLDLYFSKEYIAWLNG